MEPEIALVVVQKKLHDVEMTIYIIDQTGIAYVDFVNIQGRVNGAVQNNHLGSVLYGFEVKRSGLSVKAVAHSRLDIVFNLVDDFCLFTGIGIDRFQDINTIKGHSKLVVATLLFHTESGHLHIVIGSQ